MPKDRSRSRSPTSTTRITSAASASGASSTAPKTGDEINISKRDGSLQKTKITKLFSFEGLKRTDIPRRVGDIVAIAGVDDIDIGDTIVDLENPKPCRPSSSMSPPSRSSSPSTTRPRQAAKASSSPAATSASASTRVPQTSPSGSRRPVAGQLQVLGRGELQLAILIEMMRREGYELLVGRPEIVTRVVDGKPWSRSSTSWSMSRRTSSAPSSSASDRARAR